MDKRAVVLLSGGLDSSTVLAIARDRGYRNYALSFRYGQRADVELLAARRIAKQFSVERHVVTDIDLRQFGGSALTDDIEVPKSPKLGSVNTCQGSFRDEIPITYVPARNTIFLSFALAYAEVIGSSDIFVGVNAFDYSGYPDCRPEFISAFQDMANLATKTSVESGLNVNIHAPLMSLSKAEIIRNGVQHGVDYACTLSCYDPNEVGLACGCCESCRLRLRGFEQAGIEDPAPYASQTSNEKEH